MFIFRKNKSNSPQASIRIILPFWVFLNFVILAGGLSDLFFRNMNKFFFLLFFEKKKSQKFQHLVKSGGRISVPPHGRILPAVKFYHHTDGVYWEKKYMDWPGTVPSQKKISQNHLVFVMYWWLPESCPCPSYRLTLSVTITTPQFFSRFHGYV